MSLKVFENSLYGGTSNGGRLFRLHSSGLYWEQVCAQLNSQQDIKSLVEFRGRLYGGTQLMFSDGGRLFRLNEAGNAWEQVCEYLYPEITVESLAVFEDRLYGGTGYNGMLYRLHSSLTYWELLYTLPTESLIQSLIVFNGKLYAGTATGRLYSLNSSGNALELACEQLGDQNSIPSLEIFDNKLYGGTGDKGKLYRVNFPEDGIQGCRPVASRRIPR
jgi:outer membrane protein assembly factor BamB